MDVEKDSLKAKGVTMTNEVKVTIGVPNQGSIKTNTALSLVSIIGNSQWPTHTHFQSGCYVHENREKITLAAIAAGSSHLFFLDSDMFPDDDVVIKLMAHNKDVVGVHYNQRGFPLISTVKFADENEEIYPVQGLPDTLFKCYAVGTGCMLINLRVFDIIAKPWFSFDEYHGDILGEDIWFCRQVKRAGLEVWCDPTIRVGHIGDYEY